MLGDNTASSMDSRKWTANVITTSDGRSYIAANKIRLPDDTEVGNHPNTVDGKVRFVDRYGEPRELDADDVQIDRIAYPFVQREDLIGRAFFIFFPFPPFGNFRPRFLP